MKKSVRYKRKQKKQLTPKIAGEKLISTISQAQQQQEITIPMSMVCSDESCGNCGKLCKSKILKRLKNLPCGKERRKTVETSIECICGGTLSRVATRQSAGLPHFACSVCHSVYAVEVRPCESVGDHLENGGLAK